MRRLAALSLPLFLTGCSGEGAPIFPSFPPATERFSDVLILGIDGADWSEIDRRIEAGKLPNFARLRREGWTGVLLSLEDYRRSPVIWNTMATGVEPARHGIEDFVTRAPDGRMVPVTSAARRAPAFWHLLDVAGISVGVVGHWATWPAEPLRNDASFLVSDHILAPDGRDLAHPPSLDSELDAGRLIRRFGAPARLAAELSGVYDLDAGILADPGEWPFEKGLSALRHHVLEDVAKVEGGLALGRHFDPEVFFSYIRIVDVVQHFFRPPPASEGRILPDAIDTPAVVNAAYRWADDVLGRHLAAVREGANVIVLSDHGMKDSTHVTLAGTAETPERLGVADLVTSVLWYGKVALRVPVAGRDADGTVPAEDAGAVANEVAERVLAVRTRDGRQVFRREQDERVDVLFTLAGSIGPGEEVRIADAWVPLRDLGSIEIRTGAHRREGIIALMGPAFRSGASIEGASVFDVLPTLMTLLGEPVADDLSGRVLTEAFRDGYLDDHPVRRVARYEWTRAGSPDLHDVDPGALQRLEALGYVDAN